MTQRKIVKFDNPESTSLFDKMLNEVRFLNALNDIENAILHYSGYNEVNIEKRLKTFDRCKVPREIQTAIMLLMDYKKNGANNLMKEVQEFLFLQTEDISKVDKNENTRIIHSRNKQ